MCIQTFVRIIYRVGFDMTRHNPMLLKYRDHTTYLQQELGLVEISVEEQGLELEQGLEE